MFKKLNSWFSIQRAKNPGIVVLCTILIFNIFFFIISAFIIKGLSLSGTEKMGFFEAAFCTITMILDAGCIQFVINDIGHTGILVALICLGIVLVGMISFTGAVIGYVTNYISNYIDNAGAASKKLNISGHTVILNWNTRASEIINDLLYCNRKEKVVVLVPSGKEAIEEEINERLADTISRENAKLNESLKDLGFFKRCKRFFAEKFKNNITFIVKEGDVFSSKQLRDISLESAKTVIILGSSLNNTNCKFELNDLIEEKSKGNSQTVKTLMQVADITSADYSANSQKIVVEITDEWTEALVEKIIKCKQVDAKCNIVPIKINKILGQILSQFSLMPELNMTYQELFSNKGLTFFTHEKPSEIDANSFVSNYLATHRHVIPLTVMNNGSKNFAYYAAETERSLVRTSSSPCTDYTVDLNLDYQIEDKTVIILGHNSKCRDIMQGFISFSNEWNRDKNENILQIIVIDDQKNLEKMDYYREYPFVVETVTASIYDRDIVFQTIERVVSSNKEDTSILILSDDNATTDNIDANALANLVYVQEIINNKEAEAKRQGKTFDRSSIDIIVEIIDPKHHDIVSSYSVDNVIISNRYISKMITQIGSKEALFNFYLDILSYDEETDGRYVSKEIYIKKTPLLFNKLPEKCTAFELIRAVYAASTDPSLPPYKINPTITIGYVNAKGEMTLFSGDQLNYQVELTEKDKLIVYSCH